MAALAADASATSGRQEHAEGETEDEADARARKAARPRQATSQLAERMRRSPPRCKLVAKAMTKPGYRRRRFEKSLRKQMGPAGLEPATSWFVADSSSIADGLTSCCTDQCDSRETSAQSVTPIDTVSYHLRPRVGTNSGTVYSRTDGSPFGLCSGNSGSITALAAGAFELNCTLTSAVAMPTCTTTRGVEVSSARRAQRSGLLRSRYVIGRPEPRVLPAARTWFTAVDSASASATRMTCATVRTAGRLSRPRPSSRGSSAR